MVGAPTPPVDRVTTFGQRASVPGTAACRQVSAKKWVRCTETALREGFGQACYTSGPIFTPNRRRSRNPSGQAVAHHLALMH